MRSSLVAVLAVAATAQAGVVNHNGTTNGTTIVRTSTAVHTITSCSDHACKPTTTVPCPTISGHPSASRNGTVPVHPTGATTGLPIKPTSSAQATPSQPVTAGAASQNSLLAAGVAILMAAVAL